MRVRRVCYGWYDAKSGRIRLSFYPPDAPVRPSVEVESVSHAENFSERKRVQLLWIPELPHGMRHEES